MKLKFSRSTTPISLINLILWVPILLFCAHLLSSVRSSPVFLADIRQPFTYVLLLFSLLGLFIRSVTIYLDQHEPIKANCFTRIMKQLCFGFLVPLVSMIAFLSFHDAYLDDDPIHHDFLRKELLLVAFFLYVFNMMYVSFGLQKEPINPKIADKSFEAIHTLIGYRKGVHVPIKINDIVLISQIEQLNWIVTNNGDRYVLNISLKKASEILNSTQFFRINRNQIVHTDFIKSFRPGSYGKIELTLKDEAIKATVSKGRAKHCRKWLIAKTSDQVLE